MNPFYLIEVDRAGGGGTAWIQFCQTDLSVRLGKNVLDCRLCMYVSLEFLTGLSLRRTIRVIFHFLQFNTGLCMVVHIEKMTLVRARNVFCLDLTDEVPDGLLVILSACEQFCLT